MARFAIQLGDNRLPLTPGTWRIGRDPTCEIRLPHASVSRHHATLRVGADTVELQDHGSRNGVRVNGERVHGSAQVRTGDRIQVGSSELVLAEHDPFASPRVTATRPLPKVSPQQRSILDSLSKREREVFERLTRGETQREIAQELGLSTKTVETYRARIGEKLGARTRADLVRIAIEVGLLRPQ